MRKKFLIFVLLLSPLFWLSGCNKDTTIITTTTTSFESSISSETTTTTISTSSTITISFDSDGSSQYNPVTLDVGSTLSLPTPEKEGYEFLGWYHNGTLVDDTYSFVQDTLLIAHWDPQVFVVTYSTSQEDLAGYFFGDFFRTMINQQGQLYTYGLNRYGSLGTGDFVDRSYPVNITANLHLQEGETIKFMESSHLHTVLVTSLDRVFTWGFNYYGSLGNNAHLNESTPVEITDSIPMETGETIIDVEAGLDTSYIITSNHRIIGWGKNANEEIGEESDEFWSVPIPTDITYHFDLHEGEMIDQVRIGGIFHAFLSSEHRVFVQGVKIYLERVDGFHQGWTDGAYDLTSDIPLNEGEFIVDMVAGIEHILFLTSNNRILMLGYVSLAYFDENKTPRFYDFEDLTSYLSLSESESITQISSSYDTLLIRSSDDRIFGFGRNFHGELGLGDANPREFPVEITDEIPLMSGEAIQNVYFSDVHMTVWTTNNRILISGENLYSMLAYGEEILDPYHFSEYTYFQQIYLSSTEDIACGESINIALSPITGYVFAGWYIDDAFQTPFDETVMPAHDLTLYGLWILDPDSTIQE